MRPADDPFAKGRLRYRQNRVELDFHTADGLFSTAVIDSGTRFLLRWIAAAPERRVLDLGSGYGPIAVALAAFDPARNVLAIDRDALAVEYTGHNAEANSVTERVAAQASLGFDDLAPDDGPFDLIASNIPAKIGAPALEHLLTAAQAWLAPDGRVAIVVINRLAELVAGVLAEAGAVVHEHHANNGYAVTVFGFDGGRPDFEPGFPNDVYGRGRSTFEYRGATWELQTSASLPEFDQLSFSTLAALDLIAAKRQPSSVAFVHPGQGHLPLVAAADEVHIVDRDLLALRTTLANLEGMDVRTHHVARPYEADLAGVELVVMHLDAAQPVDLTGAVLARMPAVPMIVYGRSSDISRSVELSRRHGARFTVVDQRKGRGHAAALIRRR